MRWAQIRFCTPHSSDRFTPVSTFPLGNERREQKEREEKIKNVTTSVPQVLTTAALLCSLYLIRKISQLLLREKKEKKNMAGEMFTCILSWAQHKQFIPPEIPAKPAPPFTHRDLPAKFTVFLSDDCTFVSQTTWLSIY